MTPNELMKLFKLHQVDAAIADIKNRAAALDPGKEIMAKIAQAKAIHERDHKEASLLAGELKDHELQLATLGDKLKKIDKEIYGGSIVNAREAATLEKEVGATKAHMSSVEDRIIELLDLVPAARAKEEKATKVLAILDKQLKDHQAEVRQTQTQLAADYKENQAKRPLAAVGIDPGLMAKYEVIRAKSGGVGMAEVTANKRCGRCGMALPEKIMAMLAEDKYVTCESCHRILFKWDQS